MADRNLELALKIRSDLQEARNDIRDFRDELLNTDEAGRNAGEGLGNTSQSARELHGELGKLGPMLARLAGLFAAAFSTREIAAAAETYTTIKNRLALVTNSTEELANAQDAVFQIAQNSRQSLSSTAELYQRIATNADALNLSGAGVASVVDTVNKAMVISGTTGAAASGALTQLGQAFASGTLRGEELNSILEQAPGLSRAMADGLGVTVGQLRDLGAAGELSADRVIQALLSQGEAIDTQFNKMEVTGSQAMTVLGNSLVNVVGQLNESTGASMAFGNTIIGLSEWLDSGVLTDGLITSFAVWSLTFESIGTDINSLGIELEGLGDTGDSVSQFLANAFMQMPANLRAAIQIATIEILALFDKAVAYADYTWQSIKAIFNDQTFEQTAAALEQRIQQISDVRLGSIDSILDERDAILDNAEAERERRAIEREAREEARKLRQQEIEQLRANSREHNAIINSTNEAEQKKLDQAEQFVTQLEKQSETYGMTAQAAREYEIAERGLTGQLLARARAANRALAAQERLNALQDIRIRVTELQGQPVEAQMLALKKQYDSLLADLGTGPNADAAGRALVERLINLELAQTRLSAMESQIDAALAAQSRAEESINIQQDAGLISEMEARDRLLQIHRQTHDVLQQQRPLLEELAQQPGVVGEQASAMLEQLNNQMAQLQATTTLLESTLKDGLESGLSDAIKGLADGTMTLRDAAVSLIQSVADAMIDMMARVLAQQAISGLAGMFGGPMLQFSTGGHVQGPGTETSDSIPARLSNNEFVTRAAVVKQSGALPFLADFNQRGMSALDDWANTVRHATGGLAGVPAPAMNSPQIRQAGLTQPQQLSASGQPLIVQVNNALDADDLAQSALSTSTAVRQIKNIFKAEKSSFRAILES